MSPSSQIFVLLVLVLYPTCTMADTIVVDASGQGDFLTIQEARDAAEGQDVDSGYVIVIR